jgi:hypothetical protein
MLGSASHHRLDRDYGSRVQHHRDTVEVAVKFGLALLTALTLEKRDYRLHYAAWLAGTRHESHDPPQPGWDTIRADFLAHSCADPCHVSSSLPSKNRARSLRRSSLFMKHFVTRAVDIPTSRVRRLTVALI